MTTSFGNYFRYQYNDLSQQVQNMAIDLVEDGRWFSGRAVGILKPIALIVDIVKHILLALGHILGYFLVNPVVCCINTRRVDPIEIPCVLSDGRKHIGLFISFTFDFVSSGFINAIDPTVYSKKTQRHESVQASASSAASSQIGVLQRDNHALEARIAKLEFLLEQGRAALPPPPPLPPDTATLQPEPEESAQPELSQAPISSVESSQEPAQNPALESFKEVLKKILTKLRSSTLRRDKGAFKSLSKTYKVPLTTANEIAALIQDKVKDKDSAKQFFTAVCKQKNLTDRQEEILKTLIKEVN